MSVIINAYKLAVMKSEKIKFFTTLPSLGFIVPGYACFVMHAINYAGAVLHYRPGSQILGLTVRCIMHIWSMVHKPLYQLCLNSEVNGDSHLHKKMLPSK